MKNKKSISLLLAVCLMVAIAFSGCGTNFDPVVYTQGSLDAILHNTFDEEFIGMLEEGNTEETLKQDAADVIDAMVDMTVTSLGIGDVSAETSDNLHQMFVDVLAATKYEVGEATETDNGYTVEVTAYPLLTYTKVCNDEDGTITNSISAEDASAMTETELYETILNAMCNEMKTALGSPEYGDAQKCTLHLELDEDGLYTLNEDDIDSLCSILLSE